MAEEWAPRLRKLYEGGYERAYVTKGRMRRTDLHQFLAELLDSLSIRYEENVPVPGSRKAVADFLVNGTWVFVGGNEPKDYSQLKGKKSLVLRRDGLRSDRSDHGIRVLGLGDESGLQTIFLDDPSFNFDYAHILPKTKKCSVMHGHTSSVMVEVIGRPVDGMVVDFGEAKEMVREAVRGLDHKLFIDRKYVTGGKAGSVELSFRTVHGDFSIRAPKQTTVLLDGEATVENLSREVLGRIAPKMPPNVTGVGVYVYEGLNKGSHILARLHAGREETGRRRR
jgi:6-pyruvoyltetrahydropterin/6-carboxytetrahydropterin synthase